MPLVGGAGGGGQINKNPYKKAGIPVTNSINTKKLCYSLRNATPLSLILSRQGRGNNKQGKADHHLFSNYYTVSEAVHPVKFP
jgi:hypothetical protein